MNFKKFDYLSKFWHLLLMVPIVFAMSCGTDDDPVVAVEPIASFQFAVDTEDFFKVSFTNFSQNATVYAWDFGDNVGTSTEESPEYTYTTSGAFTVTLTASDADGNSNAKTESITITDPNEAAKLLTGGASKTWKLFREGTSMSVGTVDNPGGGWPGLTNDGSRPCLYEQTITFNTNGDYVFDDNGMFWAEYGLFNNISGCDQNTPEGCIEASAATMTNACGEDVSAFLSATHTYSYDASSGDLTLTGNGAWIGIPKLGTSGERTVPEASTTTKITIEEFTGYDVMKVEFFYGDTYWPIYYASYSDANLEPELVQPASSVDVTFSVDMNGYATAFTNVYVSGGFNDWSGESNIMTPSSTEGVYEATINISSNTAHEYKFTLDNWTVQDAFTADDACAITSDNTNYNRGVTTETSAVTLTTVCFQQCGPCGGTIAPATLGHTFADAAGADHLTVIFGGSTITLGVADPAGGTGLVGQFDRTADQFQEAQITSADPAENFLLSEVTTMTIDVYLPSTNVYTGALTQGLVIGFGDVNEGGNWWEYPAQWSTDDLALDTWHTLSYDLTVPTSGLTDDATQRIDLDMFYLGIGGGNHTDTGTFYIKNLEIK